MSKDFNANEGQKRAIEKIEGSALVIAGPGSGKTTTMTNRVLHMLQSDAGIEAHSILCLTFTDAGAVSLRQKLAKTMGQDAYKIPINTFHSFCNDVIQSNLSYFGYRDMEPVSEWEHIKIVEGIIDSLGTNHSLKRLKGDIYFDVPRLIDLWSMMKREDIPCDLFINRINEYVESLPNLPEFQYKKANKKKGIEPGDPNMRLINQVVEKMDKLSSAVMLFDIYCQRMTEHKRYTFDDMIQSVLKAFIDDEDIRLTYQERYMYVIVDESQDTSGAQHHLVNILMEYWDDPNIMLVGDINQCIYEFSGARMENINDYILKYSPEIINLNKNYRSTQDVVEVSNKLISHSKQSLSSSSASDLDIEGMNQNPGNTIVRQYANFTHENDSVAEHIGALIDSGVQAGEIFVIYRKHSHAEKLYKRLDSMGIPVNTKKRINVLDERLIQQIVTVMRYINGSDKLVGSQLFFEMLHYSFVDIPHVQIERLLIMRQQYLKEGGDPSKILESLDKRSFKKVNRFIKILEDLESSMRNRSTLGFLQDVIYKTGIGDIILKSKSLRSATILRTFFDFVKEENQKNSWMSTEDFLDLIDRMVRNRFSIPMDDIVGDSNGVFFTTCHGSKGLEAEYVFMIRCNRSDWEGARARSNRFTLPPTITRSEGDDKEESARRLFYVSMTRAKTNLYISCSEKNDNGKDMEPSQFILETGMDIDQAPDVDVFHQLLSDMQDDRLEYDPKIEKDRIQDVIDDFVMSPSSLNLYMRCPLSFYYEKILKVPYIENYSAIYGSTFHAIIEEAKSRMRTGICDIKDLTEWAIQFINNKMRAKLSEKEAGLLISSVYTILADFFFKYLKDTNKKSYSEYKCRDIVVENVKVYGEIDDVDHHDGVVDLTDYKTGNEKSVKEKMKKGEGDIWRQLIFYAILMQNDRRKNVSIGNLRVVTINKDPQVIEMPWDQNDVIMVKQQIVEADAAIREGKFHGCNDPECRWCNAVKDE